jgi:hypothetical protein
MGVAIYAGKLALRARRSESPAMVGPVIAVHSDARALGAGPYGLNAGLQTLFLPGDMATPEFSLIVFSYCGATFW